MRFVGDRADNTLSVWLNDGTGVFTLPENVYAAGDDIMSVAVGETNGDQFKDIFTAQFEEWTVSSYIGAGGSTLVAAEAFW